MGSYAPPQTDVPPWSKPTVETVGRYPYKVMRYMSDGKYEIYSSCRSRENAEESIKYAPDGEYVIMVYA